MAPLKLLSLTGASLLLGLTDAEPATKTTYDVTLADEGHCLSEINVARQAAKLPDFTKPGQDDVTKKLPSVASGAAAARASRGDESAEADDPWKAVCEYLLPPPESGTGSRTDEEEAPAPKFHPGTYAYFPLTSNTADCNAAVEKWQSAFTNFTELPPKKTEDEPLYKKQDNVSFVAMYNPGTPAVADCRVVTCSTPVTQTNARETKNGETSTSTTAGPTTTTATTDSSTLTSTTNPTTSDVTTQSTTSTSPPTGSATTPSTAAPNEASALICLTTPDAFADGNAPFTQDQWDKISNALTSSASAAVPTTLLAVAAAAAGVALL